MQRNNSHRGGRNISLFVYTVTLLWAVFIAYGTLAPMPAIPGPPRSDIIVHFLIFAILVLPTAAFLPGRVITMVLIAVALGGGIELIQPLVGRSRDLLDFLADAAGALSAWGASATFRKMRRVARIN